MKRGKEYILCFDVAMDDVFWVHVVDGRYDLAKDEACFVIAKLAVVIDFGVELTIWRPLHADEETRWFVDNLVQADYVRVMQFLHAWDLTEQQALCFVVQLWLIKNLNGYFFFLEIK